MFFSHHDLKQLCFKAIDIAPKAETLDFAICSLPFYAFREVSGWNHTPNVAFY